MISIIIPCYNEEANLKRGVLEEVDRFLQTQTYPWEIIIVDDGSTDDSLALCRSFAAGRPQVKVIAQAHGGKPHAVYGGIKEARGEVIVFTDMDQSTPMRELNKLLAWFEQGYDIVIGSRGQQREGFSAVRKIMSWGFRNVRRAILLPDILDTQCGFKAFRGTVAKEVFPLLSFFAGKRDNTGWVVSAFDVELLFIADRRGYKIKEIEVEWRHLDESVTKDQKGTKFLSKSVEMAQEILRVIWNNARGRYR